MRRQSATGSNSLRAAKIIFGKKLPLAGCIFALHQEVPRPGFRIPGKRIGKRTIRIFKHKLDCVTGTLSVSKSFRESSAENIDPMHHVAIAGVVVSDKTIAS